jgi:hypothetical protein
MSIFPDIELNQTAVYWGNPVKDGQGGFTWDDPVEIPCRWNDIVKTVLGRDGKEFVSKAIIQIDQDLDKNGMLFLGCLDDLDSSVEADPSTGDDVYIIRDFSKIPTVEPETFYRKAIL